MSHKFHLCHFSSCTWCICVMVTGSRFSYTTSSGLVQYSEQVSSSFCLYPYLTHSFIQKWQKNLHPIFSHVEATTEAARPYILPCSGRHSAVWATFSWPFLVKKGDSEQNYSSHYQLEHTDLLHFQSLVSITGLLILTQVSSIVFLLHYLNYLQKKSTNN